MGVSSFLRSVELAEVQCVSSQQRLKFLSQDLAVVQEEGVLLSACLSRMGAVKELLTKNSLRQCEELATLGVQTIFGLTARVIYDMDGGQFCLEYDNGRRSDLTSSQSGGVVTVISFVFAVYLILKLGCRRLMLWDEAWMAVSSDHYPRFIEFVNQICSDFGFDILLVSHDARLTDDMVNRAYIMEGGHARRQK